MTTLFLCGDVMIGRGIDQILEHSVEPRLYESHVTDARTYVELAERVAGPIPRGVDPAYVWGSALDELDRRAPDVRLVNLETAVTTSADAWPNKEVLYRTHPANVEVLRAARVDACSLANNHVLDWGYAGLAETLSTVRTAGIATIGAGQDLAEAQAPALFDVPGGGRVVVIGIGSTSSGVPRTWAATSDQPGVDLADGWSLEAAAGLAERLRRAGDIVVASVHWGSNWGYDVPDAQRRLAHALVDEAGVDVVHGHSSHHPRPIEVHNRRLILYGCGDFITDYEGIRGYEEFRDDLVLAYLPTLEPGGGRLEDLTMVPFRLRRFQLTPVSDDELRWLAATLDRASQPFGTRVAIRDDRSLAIG
jgi:poly-gamma-glutamate capsule biosynthesis protein CapA/YwtB (metallophosphatase superfamily)